MRQPLLKTCASLLSGKSSLPTLALGINAADRELAFGPSANSIHAESSTIKALDLASCQRLQDDDTRVTIITVCYNSSLVLPAMLASVPDQVRVVLVDNASLDRSRVREVAATFNATLIELEQNLGYGRACNHGAQLANTEYLLFLNPDATLQRGAISAFVRTATRNPEVVAMNPAILGPHGLRYFKRGSVLLPKAKWLRRGWPQTDCDVPVLTGCALFVRRHAFCRIGGFDPNIFLYHEDDDLALRLAQHGKLKFVRSSIVQHKFGSSSGLGAQIASLKGWHMGRSRVYAARKHGLSQPFARALAQACLQLASPIIWLSRDKRAKQWSFLRGVWSMRGKGQSTTC